MCKKKKTQLLRQRIFLYSAGHTLSHIYLRQLVLIGVRKLNCSQSTIDNSLHIRDITMDITHLYSVLLSVMTAHQDLSADNLEIMMKNLCRSSDMECDWECRSCGFTRGHAEVLQLTRRSAQ
jgi:hypothetical protein